MTGAVMLAVAVGLAGALGALARDGLDRMVSARLPERRVPAGVLVVNLAGSFLLGLLAGMPGMAGSGLYVLAGVGFLGAFTTFSTVAVQTVRLGRADGARNLIAQAGGCVAAVAAGLALAASVS